MGKRACECCEGVYRYGGLVIGERKMGDSVAA